MTNLQAFHGQFLLHQQPRQMRQEWHAQAIGDWTLETHPALPLTPVYSSQGELRCLFLGYPISPQGEYLPKKVTLNGLAYFTEYHWRGRYLVLMKLLDGGWRLYLDAIGSMACVYGPDEGIVASSSGLIPSRGEPESYDGVFLPAGLTPYASVKRLLPNHYLDLETLQPKRHWPLHEFKIETTDLWVEQIAERLAQNISAVVRRTPAYLSLTAGQDSRMLLAAARGVLDQVGFFTYQEDRPTVDMHIAERMAARFGLQWASLKSFAPINSGAFASHLALWERDVGYCVKGAIHQHAPRFGWLSPSWVRMPGLAGEIGRAYYWRKGDDSTYGISARELLARMKCPATQSSIVAMEEWLKSTPLWMDLYDLLDLAYIEHRLGCWAGPALYGSDKYFAGQVVPMGDRYIIERMMSLPPEYRMQQRMAPDVIDYLWPELLAYPFNTFTGWRRFASKHALRQCARWAKRRVIA